MSKFDQPEDRKSSEEFEAARIAIMTIAQMFHTASTQITDLANAAIAKERSQREH